jgi:hypothetical protein
MTESFIVCIAGCGLVDFTTEIWVCTEYAIRHKRSLIVDKTHYKNDLLGEVFDFNNWPVPVYPFDKIYTVLHSQIEPVEYKQYLTYDNENGLLKSAKPIKWLNRITFDMEMSYSRDTLLIRSSCRKVAPLTAMFFQHIGFTSDFITFFKERSATLPLLYNVAHIRHTDHKVDLDATLLYIERLMSSSELPLYLGTDNPSVIKMLVEKHGSRVHYNSSVLSSGANGKAIHDLGERYALHNAVVDMLILIRGQNNVVPQYTESGSVPYGYTRVIDELRSNRDFVERIRKFDN